jgi:hypothetical protein
MRARRTPKSNKVFILEGGNEDNDLHVEIGEEDGIPTITSVWELTPEERQQITAGFNIELTVWGQGTPPVALRTTDIPLGKDGDGGRGPRG